MLKKRFYTFIVAGHADAKLHRISIPYPVLAAVGSMAVVGLIATGIAAFHYTKMVVKVVDYDHLLGENAAFRTENHDYRIQTAQLGEKIEFLETTARRLEVLAGVNSEKGVGGAGGSIRGIQAMPRPASAGALNAIDGYNESMRSLESRYRGLEESLSEAALVESTRPSVPPLKGYITGGMGRRDDPLLSGAIDYHTGVDISAPYGKWVYAPGDGTVIFAGYREGYGNIVVIDHKFGLTTRYGHLSRIGVQLGQRVSRHDHIGDVGNSGRTTGPHLHFEILQHNKPLNPMKFIPMIKGE